MRVARLICIGVPLEGIVLSPQYISSLGRHQVTIILVRFTQLRCRVHATPRLWTALLRKHLWISRASRALQLHCVSIALRWVALRLDALRCNGLLCGNFLGIALHTLHACVVSWAGLRRVAGILGELSGLVWISLECFTCLIVIYLYCVFTLYHNDSHLYIV